MADLIILTIGVGAFALVAAYLLSKKRSVKQIEQATSESREAQSLAPSFKAEVPLKKAMESVGLSSKLTQTRAGLFTRIASVWGANPSSKLAPKDRDALEEILLEADVSFTTANKILEKVTEKVGPELSGLEAVRLACVELLEAAQEKNTGAKSLTSPRVISVVGINGVGKTTSIAKLANFYKGQGKKVLVGAADTFRAGAISQLRVWADRVGVDFIAGKEGSDPGSVAFDAVNAGLARKMDVVILDTAGRLHTKDNLMEELKTIHRVVKKVIPDAPHEVFLVLDGNLGQNSVVQARQFHEALDVTGVIMSKLDGSAKGGAIFSVTSDLGLPMKFLGVGESMTDFIPFKAKEFVDAVLGS